MKQRLILTAILSTILISSYAQRTSNEIHWAEVENILFINDSVYEGDHAEFCGLFSSNVIDESFFESNEDEAYVQWRINEEAIDHFVGFGLSRENDGPDPRLIEYGFVNEHGHIWIYERGQKVADIGSAEPDLRLQIKRFRDDHMLYFYIQDDVVYEVDVPTEIPLFIDLGLSDRAKLSEITTNLVSAISPSNPLNSCGPVTNNRNWQLSTIYNSEGDPYVQSVQHTDDLGRPKQSQTHFIGDDFVLINEVGYDYAGRLALQTKSAPEAKTDLCFEETFIEETFIEETFIDGTLYYLFAPDIRTEGVTPGTILGQYYSQSAHEEHVAQTDKPYTQNSFYADPLARPYKSANVGNQFNLDDHESTMFYMSSGSELSYLFPNSYMVKTNNNGEIQLDANGDPKHWDVGNLNLKKEIVVDVDGKVAISYLNSEGQVVAAARSGISSDCSIEQVVRKYVHYSNNWVSFDVHLPKSSARYVKAILPKVHGLTLDQNDIEFRVMDIESGQELSVSTQGSNPLTIAIPSGKYIRISYRYNEDVLEDFSHYNSGIAIRGLTFEYELDYTNWQFNYFDRFGNIVKTVVPEAYSCNVDANPNNLLYDHWKSPTSISTDVPGTLSSHEYDVVSYPSDQTGKAKITLSKETTFIQGSGGSSGYALRTGNVMDELIGSDESVERALSDNVITGIYAMNDDIDPIDLIGATIWQMKEEQTFKVKIIYSKTNYSKEVTLKSILHYQNVITTSGESYSGIHSYVDDRAARKTLYLDEDILDNGNEEIEFRVLQMKLVKSGVNVTSQTPLPTTTEYWTNVNGRFSAEIEFYTRPTYGDVLTDYLQEEFSYDWKGNLIKHVHPDKGTSEFYYDGQMLRFSQNAQQLLDGTFAYVNYDGAQRVIESGVKSGSIPSTSSLVTGGTEKVEYEYDLYHTALPSVITLYPTIYPVGYTHGKLTYSKSTESETWYGYDYKGRLIWTAQKIIGLNGGNPFTTAYTYDFFDRVSRVDFQKEVSGERFSYYYIYNTRGQLYSVHANDGDVYVPLVHYEYYLTGELKRTILGENLQGMDYTYTPQGWLKGINSALGTVNDDPGGDNLSANSVHKDLWGMSLDYFTGDYESSDNTLRNTSGIQTNLYSGQIGVMNWNTSSVGYSVNDSQSVAYSYTYDDFNQLNSATYGTLSSSMVFNSKPSYKVENIDYDLNGNLKSLTRKGNSSTGLSMDVLTYQYNEDVNGHLINNRLDYVMDAGSTSNYSSDFKNQSGSNYVYDAIGQLTRDIKDGKKYVYNSFGKLTDVIDLSSNQNIVQYTYNEGGMRLSEITYVSGVAQTQTWYVYDASGNLLAKYKSDLSGQNPGFEGPENYVYGLGRIGIYTRNNQQMIYEMKDHLGNVRLTFATPFAAVDELNGALSAQDYYPFGWTMPGRIKNPANYSHGYQGEYATQDASTGLNGFMLRDYDFRLGRWLSVDPYYQYASPYVGMGNNPVMKIDPTGGWNPCPDCPVVVNWMDLQAELAALQGQIEFSTGISAEDYLHYHSVRVDFRQELQNYDVKRIRMAYAYQKANMFKRALANPGEYPNLLEEIVVTGNNEYDVAALTRNLTGAISNYNAIWQFGRDYVETMSNPVVQYMHAEQHNFVMEAWNHPGVQGLMLLSGVGGLARGVAWGIGKFAARKSVINVAARGSQLSTRFVSTSKGLTDLKPTLNRISSGGKFPHRNDGSIFKNFEGLLPKQKTGFYREFVHPTPSIKGPGPMRIVTGQNGRMWFTPDHYKTFVPIR